MCGTFAPWYFRSLELSSPGTFAPESENDVELSLPKGKMAWNFRSPLSKNVTKCTHGEWGSQDHKTSIPVYVLLKLAGVHIILRTRFFDGLLFDRCRCVAAIDYRL